MTITLTPEIEKGLMLRARELGKSPEVLALEKLQQEFTPLPAEYTVSTLAPPRPTPIARDEWLRLLRGVSSPYGVSLTDEHVSRDSLYDDHL